MTKKAKDDMYVAPKKPTTNTTAKSALPLTGFTGFFLFLVSVSVAYANYMVFFGTDFSILNTILLAPSTVFVAGLALYKFVR